MNGPPGYNFVCWEGESHHFHHAHDVAYGANGRFVYRENMHGRVEATNNLFGDPIEGTRKALYSKPRGHAQVTVNWSGPSVSVAAPGNVSYAGGGYSSYPTPPGMSGSFPTPPGMSGSYSTPPGMSGSFPTPPGSVSYAGGGYSSFPTPPSGSVSYSGGGYSSFPTPPSGSVSYNNGGYSSYPGAVPGASPCPPGFADCCSENDTRHFPTPVTVAYGANGMYAYRSGIVGHVTFNNDTFGDPCPGVVKRGYVKYF